jgi:hypothetical protein
MKLLAIRAAHDMLVRYMRKGLGYQRDLGHVITWTDHIIPIEGFQRKLTWIKMEPAWDYSVEGT